MSFSLSIMQSYCFLQNTVRCVQYVYTSYGYRTYIRSYCADMLVIILVTSAAIIVSGQTNFHSKLWVTKILSNTLDDYVPDGGTVCKRHGIQYREGLKDLKLWATESEHVRNYNCALNKSV